MKTKTPLLYLLSFIFCLVLSPAPLALSQIPQGFNYQAIARDGTGAVIAGATLQVRFYIRSASSGGTLFYQELHSSVPTNSFGLFTLVIGNGTKEYSSLDQIDWSVSLKYLVTEVNYNSSWIPMGSSQLLTVPYAMVAEDLAGSVAKLSVEGEATGFEDALFEVKNKNGQTIFAVYNEGVRIYVDDGAKGPKGGFAVGGFDMTKATKREYLIVSDDSVRIYLDNDPLTKKLKGGFAVGGYDMTKATDIEDYLHVTRDSTRIYVNEGTDKAVKGGFSVGGFDMTKGTQTITPFTSLTPENYFIGHKSGIINQTGIHNSFVGYEAGMNNKSGRKNVFLGYHAGLNNDTASYNVFIGNEAGQSNNFGRYNAFFGYQSGFNNLTGNSNLFVGFQSGYSNSAGNYNSFLGYKAGSTNSTGAHNTFVGSYSGVGNDNGNDNTFLGYNSGFNNQSGNSNDFFGTHSGFSNSSGSNNICIGTETGYKNTTGSYNINIGYKAGYESSASNNAFIGYQAGLNNSSGYQNVFLGYQAGLTNTTGYQNIFIGPYAGQSNTTAWFNVYIGSSAGRYWKVTTVSDYSNTFVGLASGSGRRAWDGSAPFSNGYRNTFIGGLSGGMMIWGVDNIIMGEKAAVETRYAERNVLIGSMIKYPANSQAQQDTIFDNVMIGSNVASTNYKGCRNVFIGAGSNGSYLSGGFNGSGNVFIGYKSGYDEHGSNKLYIDNSGTSTPLIYGDFTDGSEKLVFNGKVGIGTSSPGNKLDVIGCIRSQGEGFPTTGAGIELGYISGSYGIIQVIDRTGSPVYKDLRMGGYVKPSGDNLFGLGSSTLRWTSIYAVNGTIQTSDMRLKDNITSLNYGLESIMKLNPVSFTWKDDANDSKHLGLVAQDVIGIINEVVDTGDDPDKTLGINYSQLVPVLIKGMQEQQMQIESTKQENQQLKFELQSLREEMAEIKGMLGKK